MARLANRLPRELMAPLFVDDDVIYDAENHHLCVADVACDYERLALEYLVHSANAYPQTVALLLEVADPSCSLGCWHEDDLADFQARAYAVLRAIGEEVNISGQNGND